MTTGLYELQGQRAITRLDVDEAALILVRDGIIELLSDAYWRGADAGHCEELTFIEDASVCTRRVREIVRQSGRSITTTEWPMMIKQRMFKPQGPLDLDPRFAYMLEQPESRI